MAAAAADIDTFLGYGERRHRQSGFDERRIGIVSESEDYCDFTLSENLRQHPLVAAQSKFLAHQFAQVILAFHFAQIGPHGRARPGGARIEYTDFIV